MPQLDILSHQVKPLVPGIGYILFSDSPLNHHRLLQDYWLLCIN